MATLEERIEQAIVDRFFEPAWMTVTQQVVNPTNGAIELQTGQTQIPAEMTVVAKAIYEHARADIVSKVIAQLDIDSLMLTWADYIAKDVVKQLQVVPDRWSPKPTMSERQKMMDTVYAKVAEEFGRQAVEHIRNTGGLMAVLEAGK